MRIQKRPLSPESSHMLSERGFYTEASKELYRKLLLR